MIEQWNNARRIVVKIGSSLLTNRDNATLKQSWLASLAEDIARLHGSGKQIIIVTSGAIAFGRRRLGLTTGSLRLEESQAAAAIGQIGLAHAYQEAFARQDLRVAQILLTLDDTERRRRYLNARSTIETLLRLGAVPIVNENDTVATSEIRYGDNDRLAARVASMAGADCLVLLSDIDGLYTAPPGTAVDARHIPVVDEITSEIEAMAGDVGTELSRGGMVTKIVAAKIALAAGTNMVIASGKQLNPLSQLDSGARCTWFLANADPMTARKRWIAGSLIPRGTLVIDEGAAGALARGKSLLPAGVAEVRGDFDRGDAVLIEAQTGEDIGRGISAYSVADAKSIVRRQSTEIADILGYSGRAEIIHRDDMVLRKG